MILPNPYHQEDSVTIYHGDCAAILPFLATFDLLLTDPPYGIGADVKHENCSSKHGWKSYGKTNWDDKRPADWLILMALGKCENAIVWGGNYFSDLLPPTMGWLVWNKMQREFSLADGELAWTSYQKALRICDVSRGLALRDGKQHPTQKSVLVVEFCIDYSEKAGQKTITTILDPFAGSGTTGLAAKNLNKKAVLIEKEEKYC